MDRFTRPLRSGLRFALPSRMALDPYKTLGVSKTATQDEIKSSYRELAKKFHPDLNPGNKEAERRFKDLSVAYEQIGTPEERAKFDRGESEQVPPGWGGSRHQGPFYHQTQRPRSDGSEGGRYTHSFGEGLDEETLESIFGGFGGARRSRRRAPQPGEDISLRTEIDLRDAVLGAEKEMTFPNGKTISVRIPAGISSGARLRFAGQGNPSPNQGPPGDAYVEVQIRPDPRFQSQGDDLILELPMSITEAVFGAEIKVPTLDGEVLLKIPPHSNTGKRLKLGGKGIFNRASKKRGDQLVVLKVVLPSTIDKELEEALKKWQAKHPYNPRDQARKAA